MLTAYAFIFLVASGYILSLFSGPFWGLLVYVNIYFNSPTPHLHWWASYIPSLRWSLVSMIVLLVSIFLHRDKLSARNFHSIKWAFALCFLSILISFTSAINKGDSLLFAYKLFTYCITAYCFIKCIQTYEQFRVLLIFIIVLATILSINAYLHGERVHARLENIGTMDAYGSNQFALLLAGITPLTLPFIAKGRWYERVGCLLALPFLLNAFILCNSRGAMVALAGAIFVTILFFSGKRVRRMMLLSAVCLVPLFLYLTDPYFIERLSSLNTLNQATSNEEELNQLSSGRIAIWGYGLQMAKDHPLGAGGNSFKELAQFYMPAEILTFHPGMEYGIRAAHNTYLQVLVEQGMLGLLFLLLLCFHTLYLLYKALKMIQADKNEHLFHEYLIAALAISDLSIFAGGLFTARLYYEFFWWQIALSVIAYSIATAKTSDTQAVPQPSKSGEIR